MDIKNRRIWQQSCGDTDRNYSKVCLEWDVILNGPGSYGKLPEAFDKLNRELSSRKITDLRRFSSEMSEGDLVILRIGTKTAFGIGIIVGDYGWSDLFRDIDGWNIQHYRRVKWIKKFDSPKKFDTYFFKQGDTTQELRQKDQKILRWLQDEVYSINVEDVSVRELPFEDGYGQVSTDEISEYLFAKGVDSTSINSLMSQINELIRIAKWYQKFNKPSEHETVAYLVIPLLRALGWTPQKMAIEWNNVDLALFKSLPRKDETLQIVVEAKQKDNSCLTAISQAENYAKKRRGCERLIVTDGLRYGIYIKNEDVFSLYSYFNLTDLRSNHHIYGCFGAKESIYAMTPEWDEKHNNAFRADV